MKIAKKVLKTIGVLLGFIVVIVLGYIIYLYASYHRIEDNKSLSVESHTETKQTLTTGKQYSAITYNIGFGAYTPDFSFFMDGGKSSWAKSKKSVLKTVKNAGNLTKSYDPDFALIEEIDLNSTRSYHVNEYSILKKCLKNYDTVFAQNYDSAFLFYPFTQPHGSSKAGLALFSRYPIKDSLRRSLPISTSYNKFFDLDRCYSISRIPVDNGKYLVIFQLHMSAYGNSDKIRKGQIRMLSADMKKNTKQEIMYYVAGILTMTSRLQKMTILPIENPGHIHFQERCFQNIFLSVWINCQRKKICGIVHEMQI